MGLGRISRRPCGEFWGRKWNLQDVFVAALFFGTHSLCLFAPFYFTWGALWVAWALVQVTGIGITLSYHRHLAHKSFKLPKWLEYSFAYCGTLAVQGSPIEWVSSHRYHHQFTETAKDPHSPLQGFWHSHIGWVFDSDQRFGQYGGARNVEDLMKQPFYRFLRDTYLLHTFALGGLLYAVGGLPFIVWGMGVRTVYIFHSTFLINSVGHMWGKQPWTTGDLSRNNWLLALLGFGEGWHNNHHAFDYSARHGLEWWQIDVTWYVILFLEAMGLATDVKFPTEIQKLRRASKNIVSVIDTPN